MHAIFLSILPAILLSVASASAAPDYDDFNLDDALLDIRSAEALAAAESDPFIGMLFKAAGKGVGKGVAKGVSKGVGKGIGKGVGKAGKAGRKAGKGAKKGSKAAKKAKKAKKQKKKGKGAGKDDDDDQQQQQQQSEDDGSDGQQQQQQDFGRWGGYVNRNRFNGGFASQMGVQLPFARGGGRRRGGFRGFKRDLTARDIDMLEFLLGDDE